MRLGEIVRITQDRNKVRSGQPSWLDRHNPDYGMAAEKIRQYIDQNPGARAVKIAHDTGVNFSTVTTTLFRYVKSGRAKKRLLDGYARYYPINRFSDERIIAKPAPQPPSKSDAKILDYIRSHPGARAAELRTLDLKSGSISWTLGRLLKQRKLNRTMDNGLWHYYADEPNITVVAPKPQKPAVAPQFATQVEQAAKDFFWEHQTDSLREFVKYIKENHHE